MSYCALRARSSEADEFFKGEMLARPISSLLLAGDRTVQSSPRSRARRDPAP